MRPHVLSTHPAGTPLGDSARKLEIRLDHLGHTAPGPGSIYITLWAGADVVAAAQLSPSTARYGEHFDVEHPRAWELVSIGAKSRYAPNSIGWVALWAGVMAELRALGVEHVVGLFHPITYHNLQVASVAGWDVAGRDNEGVGYGLAAVAATLDVEAYTRKLALDHPVSYDLFIEGLGLGDLLAGVRV